MCMYPKLRFSLRHKVVSKFLQEAINGLATLMVVQYFKANGMHPVIEHGSYEKFKMHPEMNLENKSISGGRKKQTCFGHVSSVTTTEEV